MTGLRLPAWCGWVGGIVLGTVLLVAAYAKVLDPSAFAGQISKEGLDFLFPAMWVAIFAIALEVFLGLVLVTGVRRLWVSLTSAALVIFFLFLTGRNYWKWTRGLVEEEGSCGCFGNLVQRTPAEAFWQDALLMVPALLLIVWARKSRSASGRRRVVVASLAALGAGALAIASPSLPLDDLATRLAPGVSVPEICAGEDVCLDLLVPELTEGIHWVIIADLDESLGQMVPALNEKVLSPDDPWNLWVLSKATAEEQFAFQFGYGPAFQMREAPPALLRPLYRRMPRSFKVEDGVVTQTLADFPLAAPDS